MRVMVNPFRWRVLRWLAAVLWLGLHAALWHWRPDEPRLVLEGAGAEPHLFSADGRRLYGLHDDDDSHPQAVIWDATTGRVERTVPLPPRLSGSTGRASALSPDGRWYAAYDFADDAPCRLVDLTTG